MSRLSSGGLIDRARPIGFTFDGRPMSGFAGDTLASALVANDVRLVGRSFKYHRPRGILTAGSEEPNALVTLRSGASAEPNTRATTVPLFEGLVATSQNRWPSLAVDVMAVNQLAAPLLVAGFYYKTFMWPAKAWEQVYEPLIRRAAGLGALSMAPDPDRYDREHAFCDLLIVGGGPAGLAVALIAGRAGLRVILAEGEGVLGGRLLAETLAIDGLAGAAWAAKAVAELTTLANVRVLPRTTVFGIYDGREYGAVEQVSDHLPAPAPGQPRQRLWKIVARNAVLATGAIERPLVFGGNDRPGVMMASAVSSYVNRFAAVPGGRAVVVTTGDSGWATAEHLLGAGVEVAAVVDTRASLPFAATRLRQAGVDVLAGAGIARTRGRTVSGVDIRDRTGRTRRISCDLVAMAGGWNPAIGLGSNLGARPVWSEAIQSFVLHDAPPGLVTVGAAAGRLALGEVLEDAARVAGRIIAAHGGGSASPVHAYTSDDPAGLGAMWYGGPGSGKAFVDFQHDVTDLDIALAEREGFRSVEHLKRYTTLGMATDQGKTSQLNGHALLAAATGKAIAEVGTVLSRPPYHPVSIGVLAGYHRGLDYRPERLTPSHGWAVEQGATFTDAGQWKRARWYARPGETSWRESVDREVLSVRSGVGVCDISTLGKIEVHGRDAGRLLDRLYINTFSTLPVGRARYGVMLREDGIVMDDGTASRFAEDSFFVTTTTVNAAKIMQHLDYARQVIWPELDVQAISVTEQWASFAVAGPLSRAMLQPMFPDLDLANDAFPYMAVAQCRWDGMPARIFRLSFSGELAYEVAVSARAGDRLIRALARHGRALGVTPYGTEALGVLRLEKGHVAGNELNGTTTAGDLGLGRMLSRKKDFIGRALAQRPGLVAPERAVLVGLKPVARTQAIRAGAHLLAAGAAAIAANDHGYVTSAAFSPTLGHPIGLGLLAYGRERHGERVVVHDPVRGGDVEAEVCDPVFVDPEGLRFGG